MQVMGIVQALSPKPKLHAAFPPIPDNCLTTEDAEGTEETRKRKLSVVRPFVASEKRDRQVFALRSLKTSQSLNSNVAHEVRRNTRICRPFVASGLVPDVQDVSTVIPANPGSGSGAGAGIQRSRQDRRGRQT